MRLTHKLGKLITGQAWQSVLRHTSLALLAGRPIFRLDSKRFIRSIHNEQFERIHRRYAIPNPGIAWQKYLDLNKWIPINLRRVRDLRLDLGRRKRILDIGSGTGYFLYICQCLGHDVLGLDIDEVPIYGEITRMLGLNRVLCRVKPFTPLPDLGQPFDLITAFAICFNEHGQKSVWRAPEWKFFLDDLTKHLRPGGRIHLRLNSERNGNFYDEELRSYFEDCGAEIDRNKITICPGKQSRRRLVTTSSRLESKSRAGFEHLHPAVTKTYSAALSDR